MVAGGRVCEYFYPAITKVKAIAAITETIRSLRKHDGTVPKFNFYSRYRSYWRLAMFLLVSFLATIE